MPLYSVGDMLPFVARKLNGTGVNPNCEPGRSQALEQYNRITRLMLTEREDNATAFVCLQLSKGCFTLDRKFQRILQAKSGRHSLLLPSQSFRFIDGVDFERCPSECGCLDRLDYIGSDFPTHRDLDKPRLIFAVSDRPEDQGSMLTVVGMDEYGKELRTVTEEGTRKSIQSPIIMATCDVAPQFNCGDGYHRGLVSKITMLRKPRTRGYVQVWGLEERSGDVYWITTMAPDETSPALTRYGIHGGLNTETCVFAEVSLQYAPAYDLDEISLIQQPDAYEDFSRALTAKDSNNYGEYQAMRNVAQALVKKDLDRKDGTTHRVNVRVRNVPLHGRNYPMR